LAVCCRQLKAKAKAKETATAKTKAKVKGKTKEGGQLEVQPERNT